MPITNQEQRYAEYGKATTYLNTIKNIYSKNEGMLNNNDKKEVGRLASKFTDSMQKLGDTTFDNFDLFSDSGLQAAIDKMNEPEHKGWRPGSIGPENTNQYSETKFIRADEKKTYRNLFHNKNERANLDNGGFENFGEYMETVLSGRADARLTNIARNAMREGIGVDGGFVVPEEYGGMIADKALEKQIVKPRATVIPMKTDTKKVSAWDGYSHLTSLFGGITVSYTAEGGTINDSAPKLRAMQMTAHKLAALVKPSNELLDDAANFGQTLEGALTDTFAFNEDYYYLQGTGAGQPLGILNDNALITIDPEAGQPAGTILWENLVKMYARMHPACLPFSEWYCNLTAIPQLLSLCIPMGVSGEYVPVLQKDGKGGFTILTRPVIFTEKLPALGTKGDILLADMSQYFVAMRKEVVIAVSPHVYFTTDEMAIRGIMRHDGMGSWSEPVTPKNGDTLSWCVTLAAR